MARRVFGIEAHFHRSAVERRPHAIDRFSRGDADHPFDEVEARDRFGHRMLDLETRVHFEEMEDVARLVVDELHRSGRAIRDRATELDGGVEQRRARRGRQPRRGRLLDDLLVAPLRRAVAFAERHDVSATVAEDLHLDVTRVRDEAFEEHAGIVEEARAETSYRLEGGDEFAFVVAAPESDPAAAGRTLERQRIADDDGRFERIVEALQQRRAPRERYADPLGDLAGRVLEAVTTHLFAGRSDEHEAGRVARVREVRVLRQESVAGNDRLGAGVLRGLEDSRDIEIAGGRRRRPDRDRLVGRAHVPAVAIGIGVHGDARHLHLLEGPCDPDGDLSTIRDQHFLEHGGSHRLAGVRRGDGRRPYTDNNSRTSSPSSSARTPARTTAPRDSTTN